MKKNITETPLIKATVYFNPFIMTKNHPIAG
jgi:hypothetical protein